MERERPPLAIDPAEIGAALQCAPAKAPESDIFEYQLKNEPVGISLRLALDRERRAVSLYLRGANGFLGFVHVANVVQVSVDRAKGEVTFIGDADVTTQLSVQRGGVFLVMR